MRDQITTTIHIFEIITDELETEEANKVLEEFNAKLTKSEDIEIDNAEEEIVDSENPFEENRCDFCDKMFIRYDFK